jgi:hypothetical protein
MQTFHKLEMMTVASWFSLVSNISSAPHLATLNLVMSDAFDHLKNLFWTLCLESTQSGNLGITCQMLSTVPNKE